MSAVIGPLLGNVISGTTFIIRNHYEKFDCIYNIVQAWQIKKASENYDTFSKVQQQNVWSRLDFVSLFATGAMVLASWERKYRFISNRIRKGGDFIEAAIALFTLVQGGALLGGVIIGGILSNFLQPSLKKQLPNVEISSDIFQAVTLIARTTMNIALVSFSLSGACFALSAATQAYCLIKVLNRKWIEIKHEEALNAPTANTVKFSLRFFLGIKPAVEQACTLCEDSDTPVDALFCNSHAFHESCLLTHMGDKMIEIPNGIRGRISREIVPSTHYYKVGNTMVSHHRDYAAYHVKLSEEYRPSCPTCQQFPSHNELSVQINDTVLPSKLTTYEWVKEGNEE